VGSGWASGSSEFMKRWGFERIERFLRRRS
jgi:hypothetical protein